MHTEAYFFILLISQNFYLAKLHSLKRARRLPLVCSAPFVQFACRFFGGQSAMSCSEVESRPRGGICAYNRRMAAADKSRQRSYYAFTAAVGMGRCPMPQPLNKTPNKPVDTPTGLMWIYTVQPRHYGISAIIRISY